MATLRQMKAVKNRLSLLLLLTTLTISFLAYTKEDIYLLGILGSMLFAAPAVFYALLVAIRIRWKGILWPWTQFIVLGLLPLAIYGRIATSMPDKDIEKEHFRVASYNVNYYSKSNIDAQIEALEKINADIISLLEVNPSWEKNLENYTEAYPYRHKVKDTRANATVGLSMLLSKYAIEEVEVHAEGYAIAYKVNIEGKIINLAQVHPLPPLNKALTESRNNTLSKVAGLDLGEYKIILGDFNTVHWQKPMQKILHEQGVRIATDGRLTWPALLPSTPIDHILTSYNLPYIGSGKLCLLYSDHCLIYSDINLKEAFNK
jgi:endonuclease/exonuclease/phosphatase (EEP) superfamily protein YafD